MPANLPLNFAEVLFGALLIHHGVGDVKTAVGSAASVQAGAGTGNVGTPVSLGGFPAAVDPLPGASGSRLDQGIDATGSTFLSPWAGKVVYSAASDPGWKGGGYVAIQSAADPSKVYYLAEGIVPTVTVGQIVTAGQQIADPATNPYNGIVGNVEAGLANPSSPGQPLAQVISNSATMVLGFYHWLLSLGGPQATSTSQAGYP